ncbi:tetratricopeptide repeat protein [Kitasatospora sp. NPDC096077]|uniref:tetratricopeptide repeat protein n=1 Tax=Kitasatospora sp. NPDC096077 TaxID=3155544 RepID=UPI00332F6340
MRAETPEAEALALFLRAQVDASGLTMTMVAEKIRYSRSQVGLYLSGRVPDQSFVTELIRVTVAEPVLRGRRQAEATRLVHAASNPRSAHAATRENGHGLGAELELARARQIETYERLTRALEQQAEIQDAARNSAQLVMILLTMISALEERVGSLSAERDRLLGQPDHLRAPDDIRQQLGRALHQERRAREELARAREKQRQAEELTDRVQRRVLELTGELERLRSLARGGPAGEPPSGSGASMDMDMDSDERSTTDLVGDDIDQALTRAAAVNDDQTLQHIAGELQGPSGWEPADGSGPAIEPSGVVRDGQDNPATVEFLTTLWEESRDARGTGDYSKAAGLLADLVQRCERALGSDHPDTLEARHRHACNVSESGDRAGAVRLLADLIVDRERVLGSDHPDTLTTRQQHAYSVGESGDRAGAVRLLADLVVDRERVLGSDHPDTLEARHQHAYSVGESGDRAGAVRLLADLIVDRERVLGSDHPFVLINRHQHAYNVGQGGDRVGAGRLYAEIAQDEARLGGPAHPHALLARSQQAYNLGQAGYWADASQIYARLAADCERALGPDHPDTLVNRYQHAYNLGKSGKAAEAARLLQGILHTQARVLGPNHPSTVATGRWHDHFAG